MQGCHILLLILLAAVAVAGGCTAPVDPMNAQPGSSTQSPLLILAQTVLGGFPAPTPVVPVGENKTQGLRSVGFVDPRTYHIPTPTPTTAMTKQPNDLRVSENMVGYATAVRDSPPGVLATEVYQVPFPYWAVNISATPMNDYSWLTIEIHDNEDPNRIVQTIQYSRHDFPNEGGEFKEKKERFTIREGYRDYYFIARSGSLKSLEITILVPEKYLV